MDSNRIFLIILGFFTYFLLYRKRSVINLSGFLIFGIIGYIVTKDVTLSICIASIILYCLVYLSTTDNVVEEESLNIENFKNNKKKKTKKKSKKKTFKKKRKSKKENFGFDSEDNIFDSKNTFVENYKSLTPGQIKGLNKDTQDLISTQKSLIDTLNNMGPSLKQGKQVLDTFKNYFGNDIDLGLNKLKE